MSSWIKRKLSQVTNSSNASASTNSSPSKSQNPDIIRFEVFKSHWSQVAEIICLKDVDSFIVTNETVLRQPKPVTQDDVDAIRNLLEQMIFLLAEEQSSGQQLGPILEYMVMNSVMNKLLEWYGRAGDLMKQIAINLIKVYEVIISQGDHSLLHHKQLVTPMLKLLSSCSEINCEEVDGHVVLLLNLLCVWISRDPTLLNVFFWSSDDHDTKNFIIFSHLVSFIHREGSIGQQARDALLLCVTMSSADEKIARYIVGTDFCPVLATGLSGLYSSLPRQIDVRTEEWHFLRKQDWNHVPALVNFMNSFEFCNSVVEAAESIVGETLLNYIYNGFLVSVFGPALHKPSASEVIVTTAYLNLFLQSVTAPALLRCFLKFLLCHRHDNSLIINTLIQRIGSSSKLASVSLSLFQTLLDLNCEDLMLHLVFRYLIPCQHILSSQHRSICDVDVYCASAHRFINLSPKCYGMMPDEDFVSKETTQDGKSSVTVTNESDPAEGNQTLKERASSRSSAGSNNSSNHSDQSASITSPTTMAEFGPDHDSQMSLRTSYMDYLENANAAIISCKDACEQWSEPYDGTNPATDAVTEIKGLCSSQVPGLNKTSISLLAINEEAEIATKAHAESDPIPVKYRKADDTTANPALHALNATYQAINATANALNKKTLPTVFDPPNESKTDTNVENVETVANGVTESCETDPETECSNIKQNDLLNDSDIQSHPNTLTSDASQPEDVADAGKMIETLKIDVDIENDKDMSLVQSSSVDEFFRNLMESVPKKAIENVDKITAMDEKGIEGSAEEIDNTGEESEEFHDGENIANSDEESSNVSPSTEDPDDYVDDTISVNSSFYETDLEYTPVEFSTPALAPPLKMHATPYTGPFLSTLFGKVDQMPNNSLFENLLLTGIISRLSCYPQPLLRSFLLNTHVVFHPTVRSLYQVLLGVKNRIDSYAKTVDDFSGLLCRAEKYLLLRDSESSDPVPDSNLVKEIPMPVPKVKTRNTALGEVFLRRKQKKKPRVGKLEALMEQKGKLPDSISKPGTEGQSMFYTGANFSAQINKQISDTQTKNVVFACIVMHEFLKELAAISQEHAVTCGWM